MELFVARQPIFDKSLSVYAYELLFRSGLSNAFDGTEENLATAKVISSLYSPVTEDVLDKKLGFINFPKRLLMERGALTLPPESTVIEVLETVEPGPDVVDACKELHDRGYQIALDDFIDTKGMHPLVPVADYIKVDLRSTNIAQQATILGKYGSKVKMLAEKVETQAEFQFAVQMGFSYFQGYFFAKPVILSSKEAPGLKLNYVRILQETRQPELDFQALSALISREPSLCYKLLRFVNSALFERVEKVESVERALVVIGEEGARRWVSVFVLLDLASDKPAALLADALVRARFAESLAKEAKLVRKSGDLFMVGVLSHLDAMLGKPLDELMKGLTLHEDIKGALLQKAPKDKRFAKTWEFVLTYQSADWGHLEVLAKDLELDPNSIPQIYAAAAKWADEIVHA